MYVSEIMTPTPVCIEPGEGLASVEGVLNRLQVRHLPVVDEGRLVGIISERDLDPYRNVEGILSRAVLAGEIMSCRVTTVGPSSTLKEVIHEFLRHNVGALVVVREGTQNVVGIVSYVDVLRVVQDLL